VEADVFREGTELLVGHDRNELHESHTLVRLYLEPLRARIRDCGYVLPDSTSFLLNIEVKESDPDALRLLVGQLLGYDELFRPSASGSRPPVQVTLVGWWPSPDAGLPRGLTISAFTCRRATAPSRPTALTDPELGSSASTTERCSSGEGVVPCRTPPMRPSPGPGIWRQPSQYRSASTTLPNSAVYTAGSCLGE
jgi:hypothetical protein